MKRLTSIAIALLAFGASPTVFAIDLNSATRAELERLDGFGVATAARVLAAREQSPFVDWTDFARRVKGTREHRLQQLRLQGATINGELPPIAATTAPAK